jgi:hypothetical protein
VRVPWLNDPCLGLQPWREGVGRLWVLLFGVTRSPPVHYTDCDQRVLERNGIFALDGASDRIDGFARGGFLEQRLAVGDEGIALGAGDVGLVPRILP